MRGVGGGDEPESSGAQGRGQAGACAGGTAARQCRRWVRAEVVGDDAEGSAGRCCEGQRVVGKASVLLQGCAKVRVGAEGGVSQDV